jgi:hypothetical protein
MNSPLTTPSSRLLMNSKLRFFGNGTADVYLKGYFLQLSSTSSATLGQLKPYPGAQSSPFGLRPHH